MDMKVPADKLDVALGIDKMLAQLMEEGYFQYPKTIEEVQEALEARRAAQAAQGCQDQGGTWGTALERFEQAMAG
jgi:hypothetical protein